MIIRLLYIKCLKQGGGQSKLLIYLTDGDDNEVSVVKFLSCQERWSSSNSVSIFSMCQNDLEVLLKHGLLGPRVSDSVGLWIELGNLHL